MIGARIDKGDLQRVIDNLSQLGNDIREQLADEIETTALEIETEAKQRVPVITGRLRSSIKALTDRNKLASIVGTNVEYAADVEFGSEKTFTIQIPSSGKKNAKLMDKTIKGQKAKPYLYPAYFNGVSRMFDRLTKLLDGVKKPEK